MRAEQLLLGLKNRRLLLWRPFESYTARKNMRNDSILTQWLPFHYIWRAKCCLWNGPTHTWCHNILWPFKSDYILWHNSSIESSHSCTLIHPHLLIFHSNINTYNDLAAYFELSSQYNFCLMLQNLIV